MGGHRVIGAILDTLGRSPARWSLALAIAALSCPPSLVQAQITSDGSFDTKVDAQNGGRFSIGGGTPLGNNLFHSFEAFSLPTGGRARFESADTITTIFSRVTGNTVSNIDGLIQTRPNTSLFLLNPNGLVFGPNASLDIGGSFVGSTADAVVFAGGDSFGSQDTSLNPPDPSLLTIQPSALTPIALQFDRAQPAPIVQQSRTTFLGELFGLGVQPGRSLILAGGAIDLPGGALTALGGNLELVSLAEAGSVTLRSFDSTQPTDTLQPLLRTQVPETLQRGPIQLSDDARLAVPFTPGGSIALKGGDIRVTDSQIVGGVLDLFGLGQRSSDATVSEQSRPQAGDVELLAQGTVTLENSQLFNDVFPDSVGDSGVLRIETGDLAIANGTLLSSSAQGQGNSGGLAILAENNITVDIQRSDNTVSHLISGVLPGAQGDAGGIDLQATNLSLYNGGFIAGNTLGQGRGGDIRLQINGDLLLDGIRRGPTPSYADSLSQTAIVGGTQSESSDGKGGEITIQANNLYMRNGALLGSLARGNGDIADVTLTIENKTELTGFQVGGTENEFLETYITTSTDQRGIGNGGNLTIKTGSLLVQDGNYIATSTTAQGNAGNLTIEARETVRFSGARSDGLPSFAASSVEPKAIGNGGNLSITAPQIIVEKGAGLTTRTLGQGNGGDIILNTERLAVTDGSQIFTSSFGPGNAGDLRISATESVTVIDNPAIRIANGSFIKEQYLVLGGGENTGLYANTAASASGNGGTVYLTTPQLNFKNGAQANVSAQGTGDAGNLFIEADQAQLLGSSLLAQSRYGQQGNIQVQANQLSLDQESLISTNASGVASGGNIDIDTRYLLALNNSDITANSETSFGGSVQVNADFVLGTTYRSAPSANSDITATSAQGAQFNGVVQLLLLNLDPSLGRLNVPEVDLRPPEILVTSCLDTDEGNQFVVSGRGGLPNDATRTLVSTKLWKDSRRRSPQGHHHPTSHPRSSAQAHWPQRREAQGWHRLANGDLRLLASRASRQTGAIRCPAQRPQAGFS